MERDYPPPPALRPMPLYRALVYSALGCAALVGGLYALWGWPAGGLIGLLLGALWVMAVAAWRSVQQDEWALSIKLQAQIAQTPAVVQLALGLAQPLRSLALSIPIGMLTRNYRDPGLCLLGHLAPDSLRSAQQCVDDWVEDVRLRLQLAADAPLSFLQTLPLLAPPLLPLRPAGTPEPDASAVLQTSHGIHLLLCAMETGDLPPEEGEAQLWPWVAALQQRFSGWPDYAQTMQQARWQMLRKNGWGAAAQALHFRDLQRAPTSPWTLVAFGMAVNAAPPMLHSGAGGSTTV